MGNECSLICDGLLVFDLFCSEGMWSIDYLSSAADIYCHGSTAEGPDHVTISTYWPQPPKTSTTAEPSSAAPSTTVEPSSAAPSSTAEPSSAAPSSTAEPTSSAEPTDAPTDAITEAPTDAPTLRM